MAASLNINNILSQIKKLDKDDQLTLLQRMAYLLKRNESNDTTRTRLSALCGMGSEIRESKDDIDIYIDEERKW